MFKLVLIVILAGGLLAYVLAARPHRGASTSTGPTIESIRELGSITTLRVTIADVQTQEVAGLTGSTRTVLIVKGDVELGVDLDRARFEDVDASCRSAVLVLPPPEPSRPRLDHDRTRVYAIERSGLWQLVPGNAGEAELVSSALRRAQQIVGETVETNELDARARRRAEVVIQTFTTALGWAISIRWADRDG